MIKTQIENYSLMPVFVTEIIIIIIIMIIAVAVTLVTTTLLTILSGTNACEPYSYVNFRISYFILLALCFSLERIERTHVAITAYIFHH